MAEPLRVMPASRKESPEPDSPVLMTAEQVAAKLQLAPSFVDATFLQFLLGRYKRWRWASVERGWRARRRSDDRASASTCGSRLLFVSMSTTHEGTCRARRTQATTNPAKLTRWFDAIPAQNWAIATGPISGIFVLDVDGETGLASFSELLREHGEIQTFHTFGVKTGRGAHLYFRYPTSGAEVRNSAGSLRPV